MYQTIGEEILVAGSYKQHRFHPFKFLWRNKTYKINQITLVSDIKDGGVKKRWYSVLVGQEVYRILFNRETEAWTLEELWVE